MSCLRQWLQFRPGRPWTGVALRQTRWHSRIASSPNIGRQRPEPGLHVVLAGACKRPANHPAAWLSRFWTTSARSSSRTISESSRPVLDRNLRTAICMIYEAFLRPSTATACCDRPDRPSISPELPSGAASRSDLRLISDEDLTSPIHRTVRAERRQDCSRTVTTGPDSASVWNRTNGSLGSGRSFLNDRHGAVCCPSGSGARSEKADVQPTTPLSSFRLLPSPPKTCHPLGSRQTAAPVPGGGGQMGRQIINCGHSDQCRVLCEDCTSYPILPVQVSANNLPRPS